MRTRLAGRRGRLRIAGICVVRNEADIIGVAVRHHLSLGLDHVLVLDNGSSDGTVDALAHLARRLPILWSRDDSAYRQVELRKGLAEDAVARGADWIVSFDADELWVPVGKTLAAVLAAAREAAGLGVRVRTFVQRREERVATARSLLTMTRRVAEPVGPVESTRELVESGAISFAEMLYPAKVVARATPGVELGPGSHWIEHPAAPSIETRALVCLHAPLRARALLDAKAEQGRRLQEAGEPEWLGWHVRRWARLAERGGLDAEWAANSYDAAGALEVAGRSRPLVEDRTLSDLVRPYLTSTP